MFYPFSIKTSNCSGSCNNINDSCAKICVPDVVKKLNVKVINLMLRTNERRHIKCYETCKCRIRLDASVYNNTQRWNNDKFRCECKELIDKGVGDKWSIWNPSNCKCECDKSCDVGEYLDYENCKYREKLVHRLVEECTENIGKVKINECNTVRNIHKCSSSALYIVLFSIIFTINIGITTYFVYYNYMNRNKENVSRYDYVYQATNY